MYIYSEVHKIRPLLYSGYFAIASEGGSGVYIYICLYTETIPSDGLIHDSGGGREGGGGI